MVETKYTDLKADNKWDTIDPRTQEIIALKTILKEIISNKESDRKKKKGRVWKGEWAEKPKDGETTKTIKGREVKWCEKCNEGNGGWTTSHFTDGHTAPTKNNNSTDTIEQKSTHVKLELNDDLKAAMATLQLKGDFA